ncbi:hypothetical protein QN345_13205 [Cryobacterium sp. 10I1]|uniref:hypothetical protein n=1 Tax=Cryobacterium sp. 10I1 TaxID=3048578 RepID=UPI002B237D2B|nr:hypothetical protein [Cryobacterium sp. 10I1]MEB0306261.1 hypothetical protein [Cryobacterium sp. 10I1]
MANQQSAPAKRFLVEPLSYRQTALFAAAPAVTLMVIGLGLPVLIKLNLDQQNPLVTLVEGGKTLAAHLGWVIPVIIAALLGFLAAALAGNGHSDAVEADRLRRVLGGTGLLLGTAGVLIAVYVGIYAATSPDWALFLALVPATVLIGFLALFIGRYVAFSDDEQLIELDASMLLRKERMSTLGERSLRPWWVAILTSAIAIALTAAGVAVSLRTEKSLDIFFIVLILGFAASLVVLLFGWLVLVTTYIDTTKSQFMTWAPALGVYLTIAALIVNVMFVNHGLWAGFGSLLIGGGCLFVLLFPRKQQGQWLLNRSVNGLAAASAYKRLVDQQATDSARRDTLLLSIADEASANWLKRKLAALLSLA